MKFDFIIGNPPYQEDIPAEGNKTYASPIYNRFLEAAYEISDKVEMIHPARFLFNAGSTPKQWNRQMLSDPHLLVAYYEPDCKKYFANTEIKGGLAITYHDKTRNFGAIGVFTPYPELNSIIKKVRSMNENSLSEIVVTSYAYHFTEALHKDFPEVRDMLSKGHAYDLKSNVFEKIPHVFFDEKPGNDNDYVRIYGREKNTRIYRYIKAEYVNEVINLWKYKVFMPAASGNGGLGEEIATPVIAEPGTGSTETFCSVGCFDTLEEAENLMKYIKTKFARALLSVLKVTQHITPDKWKYVPLQDFTPVSDIDWKKPIRNIDQYLYRKYGLASDEIEFIETHVKEME